MRGLCAHRQSEGKPGQCAPLPVCQLLISVHREVNVHGITAAPALVGLRVVGVVTGTGICYSDNDRGGWVVAGLRSIQRLTICVVYDDRVTLYLSRPSTRLELYPECFEAWSALGRDSSDVCWADSGGPHRPQVLSFP